MSRYRSSLEVHNLAAAPFAFLTCPPHKLRQYVGIVFTFAFRLARMGLDALRRVNRTRNQNIGAQVVKTFPLVGSDFAQIIQRGFRRAEPSPISLGIFAMTFPDKNYRGIGRCFEQRQHRACQTHRRDGVDPVLVDPFGYSLEIQRRKRIEIAGAMYDTVQASAGRLGNGCGELVKLLL